MYRESACTYSADIWAQLRFCGYNGIERRAEWKRRGAVVFEQHDLRRNINVMHYDTAGIALPANHNHVIDVDLPGMQADIYQQILTRTLDMCVRAMAGHEEVSSVFALFTRLRQCVIAPFLITPQSKRKTGMTDNQRIKAASEHLSSSAQGAWCLDSMGEAGIRSAKITKIVELIASIPKTEKVLFFSSYTAFCDLLARALDEFLPDFRYVQLDGGTNGADRRTMIDGFREKPWIRGMLVTYKVGGEGLNLIEATHCICGEPWWTDAIHSQARSRIWRTGQTRETHQYFIIARNTIEQRIMEICEAKKQMASAFLDGGLHPLAGSLGLTLKMLAEILGIALPSPGPAAPLPAAAQVPAAPGNGVVIKREQVKQEPSPGIPLPAAAPALLRAVKPEPGVGVGVLDQVIDFQQFTD